MQQSMEDFFAQRVFEMNQFYQQMNLTSPIQQNLQLLTQVTTTYSPPRQRYQQQQQQPRQHEYSESPQQQQERESTIQSKQQSQQVLQPAQQQLPSHQKQQQPPQQQQQQPYQQQQPQQQQQQSSKKVSHHEYQDEKKHIFDEVPIAGRGRNFKDLLEEKLGNLTPERKSQQQEEEKQQKQKFLKKQSRKFLSHAIKKDDSTSSLHQDPEIKRQSPKTSNNQQQLPQYTTSSPNHELIDYQKELEKELIRQREVTNRARQTQKKYEGLAQRLQAEKDSLREQREQFELDKSSYMLEEKSKLRKQSEKQQRQYNEEIRGLQKENSELKEQLKKQELKKQMEELSNKGGGVYSNSEKKVNFQQQQQPPTQSSAASQQLKKYLHCKTESEKQIVHKKLIESTKSAKQFRSPNGKKLNKTISHMEKETEKTSESKVNDGKLSDFPLSIDKLENGVVKIQDINHRIDENLFNYDQNIRYKQYLKESATKGKEVSRVLDGDGKVHLQFGDGRKEIQFSSGIRKEVVNFANGDVKQVFGNGVVVYYFDDANATQTTLPSNQNVYKFFNKQIEIHQVNGTKEIKYQNGVVKYVSQEGEGEEEALGNRSGSGNGKQQKKARPFK